ncbi:MAG: NAD(P)-dependent oxidoreductase [Nanoarchaeota archaeon]|nr:NAD(P)-dependent oxidoreductase [Nanoarchaeota archaeon]
MKKVLIFGGSGFLGKDLAEFLAKTGVQITVFDKRLPMYNFLEDIKFISGDILDTYKVNKVLNGFDIVYNLAGISDIERCTNDPLSAVSVNILGNTIILDACVKNNVKKFIFASSLYAQGNSGGVYKSTKKACESLIKDYNKYYNLDYTILQYGTIYGHGSPNTNSIYRYLEQAMKQKEINYPGTGSETREYLHVKDASKLGAKAIDEKYNGQTLIISGNNPIKVKSLFEMISDILSEIKINYNVAVSKAKRESHYKITPYSYVNEIPIKLMSDSYIDFGRGLIEVLEYIESKPIESKKKPKLTSKEYCFSDEEKNLGIDFDGVIHKNSKGFFDGTIYDDPVEGVEEALKNLSRDYDIVIYSTKAKIDRPLINGKTGIELIWEWLKKHNFEKYVSEVTSEKPRATYYIDDRAIRFKNWEETLTQIRKSS